MSPLRTRSLLVVSRWKRRIAWIRPIKRCVSHYPESWDVSPTPNRVILLKSYASMGGSITGVRNEMVNEVSNPEAFAVAMEDRVLLTGDWRVDE